MKLLCIPIFIIVIMILSPIVFALTPAIPKMIIKCTIDKEFLDTKSCINSDCTLNVTKSGTYGSERYSVNQWISYESWTSLTIYPEPSFSRISVIPSYQFSMEKELVNFLDETCKEDLSQVDVITEIEKWKSDGDIVSIGDLYISKYTLEEEKELERIATTLGNCYDNVIRREGDWLISYSVSKPNCNVITRPFDTMTPFANNLLPVFVFSIVVLLIILYFLKRA